MSTAWSEELAGRLGRVERLALLVGGAGLLATAALTLLPFSRQAMLPAYLVAYLFWVGITIGCVAITMLHHLTGGGWGMLLRRPMEAGALTVLPMALLFVPIVLGSSVLYKEWLAPEQVTELLRHKQAFLNFPFFIIRAVFYFALWVMFAMVFNARSAAQDRTTDHAPSRFLKALSGPGLVLVFLTGTFAMVDWSMSREPYWFSSLYGTLVLVGFGLMTLCSMIVVVAWLADLEPMNRVASADRVHDVGNLMLAFVMLWAYLSFMQYLIMWSGNLTEELPYYIRRVRGGWQWVGRFLILFHFVVPFCILLSRDMKRNIVTLSTVALGILFVHLVDLIWLVVPATNSVEEPYFAWGAVLCVPVAVIGVGGVWVAAFLRSLRSKPLVPQHDPGIPALAYSGGH